MIGRKRRGTLCLGACERWRPAALDTLNERIDNMPFIIETKSPRSTARSANGRALANFEKRTTPDYDMMSRHAVATLDEARTAAVDIVAERVPPPAAPPYPDAWDDALLAIDANAAGHTIGPLPDGTVIEVRPFDTAAWYSDHAPLPPMTDAEIIDAYNAQGVDA